SSLSLLFPYTTLFRSNCEHENPDVRFAVACALGNFADDPRAAPVLMTLMHDVDDDVRDWATFGLGVLGDKDSPEIREVLLERMRSEEHTSELQSRGHL